MKKQQNRGRKHAKIVYMRDNGLDVYETKQSAKVTKQQVAQQKITIDQILSRVSDLEDFSREVIRKIWESKASGLVKLFGSKNFDYYRKVLVVVANQETILNISKALNNLCINLRVSVFGSVCIGFHA